MNSVVYDVTVVGVLLVALASLPGDCFRGTAEAVNKGRASSQLAREHPSHRISPRDRIAKSSSATGLPSIFPSFPAPIPLSVSETRLKGNCARRFTTLQRLATSSPLYARFAKKLRRYLVLCSHNFEILPFYDFVEIKWKKENDWGESLNGSFQFEIRIYVSDSDELLDLMYVESLLHQFEYLFLRYIRDDKFNRARLIFITLIQVKSIETNF